MTEPKEPNDKQEQSIVLLPCPCCGDTPVRQTYEGEAADQIHKIEIGVVRCLDCGLSMETSCGQPEADARWNRRYGDPCREGCKIKRAVKEMNDSLTADY